MITITRIRSYHVKILISLFTVYARYHQWYSLNPYARLPVTTLTARTNANMPLASS